MIIRNEQDLEGLRKIGRIVALAREEMKKQAKPGMTTKELDLRCRGTSRSIIIWDWATATLILRRWNIITG